MVRVVAANEGARFSGRGYAALVDKARVDPVLATTLRARQDLPPAAFEKLMAQAAAAAARDIDARSADVRAAIDEIAHRATEEIESRTRTFRTARAEIHQLAATGRLDQVDGADLHAGGAPRSRPGGHRRAVRAFRTTWCCASRSRMASTSC